MLLVLLGAGLGQAGTPRRSGLPGVYQAYEENDIPRMLRLYREYVAGLLPVQRTGRILSDFGMRWRVQAGVTTPEYTQRILVLFITRTRAAADPALPPRSETPADLDSQHVELVKRNCGKVARFVEAASRGKLRLEFDYRTVDAAVTRLYPNSNHYYIKADFSSLVPFPAELIHNAYKTADTIFTFYPMPYRTYCYGGSWPSFPVVPYTLEGARRGRAEFNTLRGSSFGLILHEYFHTLEREFGFHCQDDFMKGNFAEVKKYFPDFPLERTIWGGQHPDYYDWQFSVNIPRILEAARRQGDARMWRRFAYHATYPYRTTDAQFAQYRRLTAGVPVAKLREAHELRIRANDLWRQGDKAGADALMDRVIAANPGYADFWRHAAERHIHGRRYPEAMKAYETYFRFEDNWYHYWRAGRLAAEHLKDRPRAERYYRLSLAHADAGNLARARFEWAWAMGEFFRDWKQVLELTTGLAPGSADRYAGEAWYLRAHAAFRAGRDGVLRGAFAEVVRAGLLGNPYYARHAALAAWEAGNAERDGEVLRWAPLALRFADARWGSESRYLYGQALWRTGRKVAGEREMRTALARHPHKNWLTGRFARLTGKNP